MLILPQLTHIATVIHRLTSKKVDEIHKIWEDFIHEGSPKVVDIKMFYTPIRDNALGLHRVADFRGAVKTSWLRRLPYTKSLWRVLYLEEVKEAGFNPINYNFDMLETARRRIKNKQGKNADNNFWLKIPKA